MTRSGCSKFPARREFRDVPSPADKSTALIDVGYGPGYDGKRGRARDNEPAPLIRPLERAGDEPMASYRKKGRVWYYRFIGPDGIQHEVKGCSDRRETEAMAAAAEAEAAKIRSGYIDPKEPAYASH